MWSEKRNQKQTNKPSQFKNTQRRASFWWTFKIFITILFEFRNVSKLLEKCWDWKKLFKNPLSFKLLYVSLSEGGGRWWLSLGLLILFFNSVSGICVSWELRSDQSLTVRVKIARTGCWYNRKPFSMLSWFPCN